MSAVKVLSASRLTELESTIERGLSTFVEVGQALAEIRDTRLYRETHRTFDDYCRERWRWSRQHAYRLIDASEYTRALSPTGDRPHTEGEARRQIAGVNDARHTPQPSEVADLVGHVEELNKLRASVKAKRVADRLHLRSRAAFARRLRLVGTYLGSIALVIEEEGERE